MPDGHVSATQLGAIGENLVANPLIVASDGRLAPFGPVADDSEASGGPAPRTWAAGTRR